MPANRNTGKAGADKRKRSRALNLIFLAIGLGLILVMLLQVDLQTLSGYLAKADPMFILAAIGLNALAVGINVLRWTYLYPRLRPLDSGRIFLVGMAINQVSFAGSGEAARCYTAKKKFGVPVADTLAPSAIERLLDTTMLVSMAFVTVFLLFPGSGLILQVLIPGVIITLGAVFIGRPALFGRIAGWLEGSGILGRKLTPKTVELLRSFETALRRYQKRRGALALAGLLTFLIWLTYCLGLLFLIRGMAFAGTPPSIWILMPVTCAAWIIGIFSFLPNGIGSRDVVFAALMGIAGLPLAVGLGSILTYRAISYLVVGILAPYAFGGGRKARGPVVFKK